MGIDDLCRAARELGLDGLERHPLRKGARLVAAGIAERTPYTAAEIEILVLRAIRTLESQIAKGIEAGYGLAWAYEIQSIMAISDTA